MSSQKCAAENFQRERNANEVYAAIQESIKRPNLKLTFN